MVDMDAAGIALSRFGLGARSGDRKMVAADPRGALKAEIADRRSTLLQAPDLPDSVTALTDFHEMRSARRQQQAAEAAMQPEPAGDKDAIAASPLLAEYRARAEQALAAPTGFAERWVAFWSNHFAVAQTNGVIRWLAGPYEREAIRPYVFSSFWDLLASATRHPAMLAYLNNATSVGPDSPAGRRGGRGLNENHARELMELHTIGVDAGYTQADVTSLAKVLTGWTYGQKPSARRSFGRFEFDADTHEPGAQTVLGKVYPQGGEQQGLYVLQTLVTHPTTASHLASKLVRHFIADVPPPDAVARLAAVFRDTGGDLAAVAAALVDDETAWTSAASKMRSPQEFVWAALRALNVSVKPRQVQQALAALGQPLWNPPSPEGYHDDVATWLAPAAMTNRLDVAQQLAQLAHVDDPRLLADELLGPILSDTTRQAIERAESPVQGMALLLMSPEFQRR